MHFAPAPSRKRFSEVRPYIRAFFAEVGRKSVSDAGRVSAWSPRGRPAGRGHDNSDRCAPLRDGNVRHDRWLRRWVLSRAENSDG